MTRMDPWLYIYLQGEQLVRRDATGLPSVPDVGGTFVLHVHQGITNVLHGRLGWEEIPDKLVLRVHTREDEIKGIDYNYHLFTEIV